MKSAKRKKLYRATGGWLLTVALVYAVFIGALAVMQKHLMYFPDPARFSPSDWALRELEPLPVTTEDGLHITSWYHPAQARDKLTIVFFQGNAGHLGYRNYKVRPWIDAGYGVLMVGYRGYGNPGSPSEEGLYMDAQASIDAIRAKGVPEAGLVLYGESLGSGVATQMATEYAVAGLILEGAYTTLPDVAAVHYPLVPVRLLLRDRYNSLARIKDAHAPLLLLHGERDRVVPVVLGHRLFEAANEPKREVLLPDSGHNDTYTLKTQQIILNFLASLPTDILLNTTPTYR